MFIHDLVSQKQQKIIQESSGLGDVYRDVAELNDLGLTLPEIAQRLGMSTQEAEEILAGVQSSANDSDISEAASWAQQAAIAIAKKKKQGMAEGIGDTVQKVATTVGDKLANALPKEMQPFNNDTAAKTYASLKPAKEPVKENTGVTKHNDYNSWRDEVSAQSGIVHPQRDRNHLVAQSWDGDTMGEFNLRTNQGWINSQQGVTENADQGEQVLNHFANVVADEFGYDPEKVLRDTVEELTTPSGVPVYSFSDDSITYYMGVLGPNQGTAIVEQSMGGGGEYMDLELSIGGRVLHRIRNNRLYQGRNVIAKAKPDQDEYDLVGIALDVMWGRMQHKFMEQGVAEGADDITQAKERLAYLEQIFDTSYEYSDDHSVWKKHNAIRQEMDRLKKIIGQGKHSVEEESNGLWANIHAKRERIKHGSGERMRKPGSKGAPTADALRKSAK
jgi:hypothetical protein